MMGSSYTNLLTHIVFSTTQRIPYLTGDRRDEVFAYIGGLVREIGGTALNVNGTKDHVHILASLPARLAVAEAVKFTKANSTLWIHRERVFQRSFAWQVGYGAFSVSESNVANVSRYISNQETHHTKRSFQDELIELLKSHGIQYDERYIWK